ncbi:MAG: ABC transporter substrate-binding protein [Chloroflexales bacterium]|nr:ABC transporter substrate-binding protein [Chloroflexales bacterium]
MRVAIGFGICVALLLSACSTPAAIPPTAAPAADSAAPADTPAPPAAAASGELRIATGLNIPTSLIATQGTNGFNMITYGAGETLMRLMPEQQLEPWLAQSVERSDERTWTVTLREGVRFHDGSILDAQAVADSFASSWANLPGAATFVPSDTEVLVRDALTLTFTTPEPLGGFRYSLANWNFVIHKPPVDDISIMTGPYRPVELVVDQEFVLEQFAEYWGVGGALDRIRVIRLPDANARALALQSGDVDMLTNVPPDIARGLPPDIEQVSIPGTRMHHIILNHTRAPFDDRNVREAVSLAIDREALLQATLDGQGQVAVNLYPASLGLPLVEAQRSDVARAQTLLEEAGWIPGSDGVRTQDGQRLEVLLYSYPGRPELTQMAVAIQAMLGEVGFAVTVEEVSDIVETIEGGAFQASMFSIGVQSDPLYMPAITLAEGGAFNYGGYRNSVLEELAAQLRAEDDPAIRSSLAAQVQEQVQADTPNIYLATPPLITAFRQGHVINFTPNPNDLYLVTPELGLGA